MFDGWSVPVLVLHALGGVLALRTLARPRSPQGTLAWVLALLFLPLVSIPVYLMLHAPTRWGRKTKKTVGAGRGEIPASLPAVAACTGVPATAGNEPRGRSAYLSIARAVAQASHSVSVEFYIIRNDLEQNVLIGEAIQFTGKEPSKNCKHPIRQVVVYDTGMKEETGLLTRQCLVESRYGSRIVQSVMEYRNQNKAGE